MKTFVIRLWEPAEAEDDPEMRLLRGFAEHIGGGERTAFCGSQELLAFLERFLGAPPSRDRAP